MLYNLRNRSTVGQTARLQIAAGYRSARKLAYYSAIGCARCGANNERGRTRKSKKLRSSFTVKHTCIPPLGRGGGGGARSRSLRKNRSTSDRNLADERVEGREDYRAGAHAFAFSLAFSFAEAVNFFEIDGTCYSEPRKTLHLGVSAGRLLAPQLTISKSLKSFRCQPPPPAPPLPLFSRRRPTTPTLTGICSNCTAGVHF